MLALADSDAVPDPEGATGFKHNKVKKCKRKQLVGLLGKRGAHQFCGPIKAGVTAVDQLVGTSITMSTMVNFGSGLVYYCGGVVIVGVSGNDKYKMKASKGGVAYEFTEHKALIRGLVSEAGSSAGTPTLATVSIGAPWNYMTRKREALTYIH